MFTKYSTGAYKKLLCLNMDATHESEIKGKDLSVNHCCRISENAFFILEKNTTPDPDSSSYWWSWTPTGICPVLIFPESIQTVLTQAQKSHLVDTMFRKF